MKNLSSYTNAKAATDDLPYGAFANESSEGEGDGTSIVAEHMQDLYYSLYQVLQLAGNTPNGSLEDGNTSKQFLSSLGNCSFFKYSSTSTYALGAICFTISSGIINFYKSLVAGNTALLTDTDSWLNILRIDADGKFNFLTDTNINSGIKFGTCSTASATTEKAVTLDGFSLSTGATIQVTFTNANTATTPTLNVNSTGALAIYNEAGTAVSGTNPAYFPAGSTVEFTYDGTNWVFKKRVVQNYANGTSWYRIYSDGWIEQGGRQNVTNTATTISLLQSMKNTTYSIQITPLHISANVYGVIYWNSSSSEAAIYSDYFQIISSLSGSVIYYWEVKGY